jgi:Zn-finger protein
MIYTCEDCGFIFSRMGEVKECPSCEKIHIRSATSKETKRLLEILEQGKTTPR